MSPWPSPSVPDRLSGLSPLWYSRYPFWMASLWAVTEFAVVVAWGMYVRARRQLLASLGEQVARAKAAQKLLAEQARQAERTRIAQETHDVLGHRISLMALHAGALEVRPDLPPAQVAEAAGLIAGPPGRPWTSYGAPSGCSAAPPGTAKRRSPRSRP